MKIITNLSPNYSKKIRIHRNRRDNGVEIQWKQNALTRIRTIVCAFVALTLHKLISLRKRTVDCVSAWASNNKRAQILSHRVISFICSFIAAPNLWKEPTAESSCCSQTPEKKLNDDNAGKGPYIHKTSDIKQTKKILKKADMRVNHLLF